MKNLFYIAALTVAIAGCKKDDSDSMETSTFKVEIQNVSTTTTLQAGAVLGGLPDRTVPLSHGPWAVFSTGSLFTLGQPASDGISRLAEDGMSTVVTNDLNNSSFAKSNGEFVAPGGPDMGSALFFGEKSTFMVTGEPGDKLQILTMFVQSNDWFYSFGDGGLSLFNGDAPVSGDMTSKLVLYDAGTEADEQLGLGMNQKPDQGPLEFNIGPDDSVNMIKIAATRHPSTVTPAITSVIKITITPQ